MKLSLFAGFVAVALVSAVTAASSEDVQAAWDNFKTTYGKQYRSLYEETVRKVNFIENFNKIATHNERYAQGLETYTLKINKYSDLTTEEFKKTFNGYKRSSRVPDIEVIQFIPNANVEIPDEFDWRDSGAVTAVKDQGQCGSCWSFSATGSLEGQYFLKTGVLRSISEQNLVDCSRENSGCDGGDMSLAFVYIHDNDGIDSEESYPYEAVDRRCRYIASENVTSTRGYASIEYGNELHLKAAIATVGPIAVAIDASEDEFDFYNGGIYYNRACTSDPYELDHAVLAVGYGTTEHGEDYWLVKNSWGTDWGEDGYIRMARNRNNNCGVASDASYPINY